MRYIHDELKPSVVLISGDYAPNIGGLAGHVHELAHALHDSNHLVSVITSVSSDTKDSVPWNVFRIPPKYSRARWIAKPQIISQTKTLIEQLKQRGAADIIHWHTLDHFCQATKKLKHSAKVFTNHTSHFTAALNRGRHARLRRQIGHAHAWITVSERLRLNTLEIGVPNQDVHLITNGVNVREFKPRDQRECRKALGLPTEAIIVLYAGRIEHVKGTDVLADAIKLTTATQQNPDIRFVFVGDHARAKTSDFEQNIDEKLQEEKSADIVLCKGPQPRQEMPYYYAAADFVVLPSRNEATSLTALESMACATPVIASSVGGLIQIIEHKHDGQLVKSEDSRELAAAIISLAHDENRRTSFGERARKKVVQEWSWANVAHQTSEVYQSLLGTKMES